MICILLWNCFFTVKCDITSLYRMVQWRPNYIIQKNKVAEYHKSLSVFCLYCTAYYNITSSNWIKPKWYSNMNLYHIKQYFKLIQYIAILQIHATIDILVSQCTDASSYHILQHLKIILHNAIEYSNTDLYSMIQWYKHDPYNAMLQVHTIQCNGREQYI